MKRFRAGLRAQPNVNKRFALLGMSNLAATAINFATSLLMARALGAAGFGEVSLGLNLLSYGLILMNFGTDMYGVRAYALDPRRGAELAKTISLTRVALSAPILLMSGLVCLLLPSYREAAATVMLLAAAVLPAAVAPLWFAQAREATGVVSLALTGNAALNLLLAVLVFMYGGEAAAYAGARLVSDIGLALGLGIWGRRFLQHGPRSPRLAFGDVRQLLRDCWPIGASKVVRGLGYSSDLFILGLLASHTTLGIYAAAFRIYSLLVTMSGIYAVIVLPRFSRAAGTRAWRDELSHAFRWAVPTVAVGAIVLAGLGPELLPFLFGASFAAGAGPLALLMLAGVLGFVSRTQGQALIGAGRAHLEMRLSLSAMSVAIAAKLLLTWQLGILGTAMGTLLGEAVLVARQTRAIQRVMRTSDANA